MHLADMKSAVEVMGMEDLKSLYEILRARVDSIPGPVAGFSFLTRGVIDVLKSDMSGVKFLNQLRNGCPAFDHFRFPF